MTKSESIQNLAKALLKFQSKGIKVGKEASNPFFKSKYASLANILDVISSPLSECGLCYSQMPDGKNLTTILMHESGEWIESVYEMPIAKPNDPQAVGSAITYARRYAIGAVLGLNIDDDDDGNKASGHPVSKDILKIDTDPYFKVVKYLADNDSSGKAWKDVQTKFIIPNELLPEIEADIAKFIDPTGHGVSASADAISKKVKVAGR